MKRFAAAIIGLVFFLSGSFKLIDPVGTGFIVTEYFNFFHCTFLQPVAKAAGMLLSGIEAVTGIALLTGVARKAGAIAAMSLTGLFTIISTLLLIFNPPMDSAASGRRYT